MNFRFESNSEEVIAKLKEKIKDSLNEIGTLIVAEAQVRTPVDTGTLRRGETFKIDENTVYVGSNVPYDEYVELGTSKQEAQPHWTPAVMGNIEEIKRIVRQHLEEVGD